MKKHLLSLTTLLFSLSVSAQVWKVHKTDGTVVSYPASKVEYVTVDPDEPVASHEYVDLGLPSGTLWATCNIGADTPEQRGDYFAWGETEGYRSGEKEFTWQTYKWCNGSHNTLTKYCTNSDFGTIDSLTELQPEDDAAYICWGEDWRTPSQIQARELLNGDYTTLTWTTRNGIEGYEITSKANGNSIFLPGRNATRGYYWLRMLAEADIPEFTYLAYYIGFTADKVSWTDLLSRQNGIQIRPVRRATTMQ
ncbi:MAG: hypothetical protein IJ064_00500 [Bacteroidaceae bacterium]|nr:hypothetical protein [Bacteroidaceae bacterium]